MLDQQNKEPKRPPHDLPLNRGERCEIFIDGPETTKGCLNNPEEMESAFWGDWFCSGDIGLIVDRLKGTMIIHGKNVYVREVEESFLAMGDGCLHYCKNCFKEIRKEYE